ncbi:MAG: hypothetical protein ACOH5I_17810 [Oligoflexus sp.]
MTKKFICFASCLLFIACDKPSKSPPFNDSDVVEVSGIFLLENGEPLMNTPIHFRNFRYFAYYDQTIPFTQFFNFLMRLAFPFFPIYDNSSEPVKHKAGYFFDQVKTNEYGEFRFQVYAGQLLRDSEGGINISLVNDGKADVDAFSRFNFVIKQQKTELNSATICRQSQIQVVENGDRLDFSWPVPSEDVNSFELIFADARDNSLVWAEKLAGTETSLSLPKLIFQDLEIKVAIETFFQKEEEFILSCLGPSTSFQLDGQIQSIARDHKFHSQDILFDITSLTNSNYYDPIFFQAFDVKRLELDFETTESFSTIITHNLQFVESQGHVISIQFRNTLEEAWQSMNLDGMEAKRFQSFNLGTPISARYLRFDFENYVSDLQEITIY